MIQPSRQRYEQEPPQPLVLSFPQAELDAFACYRRTEASDGPSFLLETGRPPLGQPCYSFFGARPSGVLSARGRQVRWSRDGNPPTRIPDDPLTALMALVSPEDWSGRKDLPPFVGGAVGFLSYDFVRSLETLPTVAQADLDLPDFQMAFYDLIGAIDHETHTVQLIFTPSAQRFATEPRARLFEEGVDRLEAWRHRLLRDDRPVRDTPDWRTMTPIPGQDRSAYIDRVVRCQEYIRAGDIYQANLSHRFTVDLPPSGLMEHATHHDFGATLYRRLREVNPSPFSALLASEDLTLVSCSPERLVRMAGRTIETRPIAGTRPRGAGAWEDDRLKHELLANAKERAEHVMLVDLERNDLGRVCEYGTVRVDEFLTVEQYSHVSHLVSNVRGTLRPEMTGADVLRAVFPGGTITGVPKVRCMEIIEELEPVRRGIYTGSLGYVSRSGNMDWNILIRTMLLHGQRGYVQVGAGIVADSDPAREYEETLHKGQALFSALGQS